LSSAYINLAWLGLTSLTPVDRTCSLHCLDGGGHALGMSVDSHMNRAHFLFQAEKLASI
jgi:hypothetical protein